MEVFVKTKNDEYKMNSIDDIYCKRTDDKLLLYVSGYDASTNWKVTMHMKDVTRINEYYGPACSQCDVHVINSDGDLLTVANQIAFRLALEEM